MSNDGKRTTQVQAPTGLGGQMRRLGANSAASAAELREFLGQMRGKSPHEVMGLVASSGLVQSTLLAFGGAVVLILILTIVPAMLAPAEKPVAASNPPAPAQPVNAENKNAAHPPPKTADANDKAADTPKDKLDPEVAKKLGISGTADPDKKENPLEDFGNDLLKDIK